MLVTKHFEIAAVSESPGLKNYYRGLIILTLFGLNMLKELFITAKYRRMSGFDAITSKAKGIMTILY